MSARSLLLMAPLLWLLGLLLALPLLPLDLHGQTAYNAARVAQGILLTLTAVLMIRQPSGDIPNLIWPWAVLLALAISSSAMAAVPALAWRQGVWDAAWLLSLPLLAESMSNPAMRLRALGAIVVGQFVYVLLASAMLFYGLIAEQFLDSWHAFPGYENPRYFNHTQTLGIPLLAAYSLWPQAARSWRRLAAAACVLHLFLIYVFLARATLVGLGIAALVVALGLRDGRLLKALLLYAILGMLLYVVGLKGLPQLLGISEVPIFRDPAERGSIEARFYLWQIALQAMSEHPMLGLGPMHFAHTVNGEAAHPHNIYLQMAAEYGLPFALIALTLLARWLYRCFVLLKTATSTQDFHIETGCFVAIAGALVDGLFSGNFVMPISQSWMALCVGLLLALQQEHSATLMQPLHRTWRHWLMSSVSVSLAVGLFFIQTTMIQELKQSPVNVIHGPSLTPDQRNPRFWADGWF